MTDHNKLSLQDRSKTSTFSTTRAWASQFWVDLGWEDWRIRLVLFTSNANHREPCEHPWSSCGASNLPLRRSSNSPEVSGVRTSPSLDWSVEQELIILEVASHTCISLLLSSKAWLGWQPVGGLWVARKSSNPACRKSVSLGVHPVLSA